LYFLAVLQIPESASKMFALPNKEEKKEKKEVID